MLIGRQDGVSASIHKVGDAGIRGQGMPYYQRIHHKADDCGAFSMIPVGISGADGNIAAVGFGAIEVAGQPPHQHCHCQLQLHVQSSAMTLAGVH